MSSEYPFRALLRPAERIVWEGQPIPRRWVLTPADIFLIPFSIMWGGFALFWEAAVLSTPAPFFFKLWGVPFVLVGLYLMFGRFFVAYRQAQSTWYALTDRRVLIASGIFRSNLTEIDLRSLPALNVQTSSDGVGTISLSSAPASWTSQLNWSPWMAMSAAPAFRAIPDAPRVYQLMQEARERLG